MHPIFTFTKQIAGTEIAQKEINDISDIKKLDDVVQRLEALPSVSQSRLEDIGLRTNPKKWIKILLDSYPKHVSDVDMENLLFDFTDSMQTRMREENKYALGLLLEGRLVLCHSKYGQKTITPEWKIIPRMLDIDNILRYVSFSQLDGDIYVNYWERSATSSFIEWLGLPRKQAFLFGGKYRVVAEVEHTVIEFQLTEDEMEQWIEKRPEFKMGEIRFSNPINSLKINKVRIGSKQYDNTKDFIQDYRAEQHGIPVYRREYRNIKSEYLPLLMKYYDEETQVVRIEGDEKVVVVDKTSPHFHILFADGDIEMRASYSHELAMRLKNKEKLRVFHAGMQFKDESFSLGNLNIFNDMRINDFVEQVVSYYNEINLQDVTLDIIFQYVIFQILAQANHGLPIEYVFTLLAEEITRELIFQNKLTKVEDRLLEYKSRDILNGNNGQIINTLADDIRKKLKNDKCKLYIVGVEDDGTFDPILASRMQSDRIEKIRQGLQRELPTVTISAFPVTRTDQALLFILAL